jgi:hypothetical protein
VASRMPQASPPLTSSPQRVDDSPTTHTGPAIPTYPTNPVPSSPTNPPTLLTPLISLNQQMGDTKGAAIELLSSSLSN